MTGKSKIPLDPSTLSVEPEHSAVPCHSKKPELTDTTWMHDKPFEKNENQCSRKNTKTEMLNKEPKIKLLKIV